MARKIDRLTDRTIKAKKAKGYYADGNGLYLQVSTTGSKSWVFRFKRDGKARDMGLGSFPTVSLADARKAAQDARKQRDADKDPIAERDAAAAQKRRAEARGTTFQKAAETYIEANKRGWKNAKHRQQWENTLKTYVYPAIGDLPVEKIGVADVRAILKAIWADKPETASRVRGRIEVVIRAARSDDDSLWANPADWERHKDHFAKRPKPRHQPALLYKDVPAFMTRLRTMQGVSARALEVTILTALRTSEVIGATFDEFDFDAKVWSVPPERMKGREKGDAEFRVPLCNRAVAIVKQLAAAKVSKFVFPGLKPDEPLSNMAMLMMLRDMHPDITVHGFRSSFRDWAEEQARTPDHDPGGTPGSVREYALSHMPKDKVKRAYLRADLLEKRRPLMEAWANYCGSRPQPAKPAKPKQSAVAAGVSAT